MQNINIIGNGCVTKQFLKLAQPYSQNLNITIYSRLPAQSVDNVHHKHLDTFQHNGAITFTTVATNEEAILRETNGEATRLDVTLPNLKIIMTLAKRGIYDRGEHFIVTSASDIIADCLIRKTHNKNIYSLGLSHDKRRYQTLLGHGRFDIIGNHYEYPLVVFHDMKDEQPPLPLISKLKDSIHDEFNGFKPPILSGASCILDTVLAQRNKHTLPLCGYSFSHRCVVAGLYDFCDQQFLLITPPQSLEALLTRAITEHREHCQTILGEL